MTSSLTARFLDRTIDPEQFGHEHHVRVAYELLDERDFLGATVEYVSGIRAIVAGAGVPEKFHMTITVAFLSLIAERMATTQHDNVEDFLRTNHDLLSKEALFSRYSASRLHSTLARDQFVLPSE